MRFKNIFYFNRRLGTLGTRVESNLSSYGSWHILQSLRVCVCIPCGFLEPGANPHRQPWTPWNLHICTWFGGVDSTGTFLECVEWVSEKLIFTDQDYSGIFFLILSTSYQEWSRHHRWRGAQSWPRGILSDHQVFGPKSHVSSSLSKQREVIAEDSQENFERSSR